jgi:hypothetical protein
MISSLMFARYQGGVRNAGADDNRNMTEIDFQDSNRAYRWAPALPIEDAAISERRRFLSTSSGPCAPV